MAGKRYFFTVSLTVALNLATAVFAVRWAVLLSLHLPLLSFGRSPETTATALPVPVAPANLPVLLAPSTEKGTVSLTTTRQVLADMSLPVGAGALP